MAEFLENVPTNRTQEASVAVGSLVFSTGPDGRLRTPFITERVGAVDKVTLGHVGNAREVIGSGKVQHTIYAPFEGLATLGI
ncbi:MAG TPA: hypothetical protein VLF43_00720 [Candidatus Saccharimonadales bacterium]|nr:hypothetical protein [Candidatus Saccharimonadales bacterium]